MRSLFHRHLFFRILAISLVVFFPGKSAWANPVAYITGLFADPFSVKGAPFAYYCVNDPNGASGWILWSPSPDGVYDMDIDAVKKYYAPKIPLPSAELLSLSTYDPTNGYYSSGDVYRVKQ